MYLDSGFHLLSFCCYLYGIWNEPSSLFLCHESDILQSNRNLSRKRINNFFRFKLFSIYKVIVHARRTQTLIPNTRMKYKQDFKGSCLHLLTFTASTPNLEQIKMIKERLPLLSYQDQRSKWFSLFLPSTLAQHSTMKGKISTI